MLWSKVTMRSGSKVWINLDQIQFIEEAPSDSTADELIMRGLAGGIKMPIKEVAEEIFAKAVRITGISLEEFTTGIRRNKRGDILEDRTEKDDNSQG